jgi:hypothetical protein
VEGLTTSTLEFYAAVEKAIRDKEAPALKIERVLWSEHGLLTAKREYLRIGFGRLRFDVCAAPFGKDFFFSWWLAKRTPNFAALYGCAAMIVVPVIFLFFIATIGFFKGIVLGSLALVVAGYLARGALDDKWSAVEDTILAIPTLGVIYAKFVRPVTYYSEDSRLMFEETVHRVVLQVVSGVLTLNKLPELSPEKMKAQSRNALL